MPGTGGKENRKEISIRTVSGDDEIKELIKKLKSSESYAFALNRDTGSGSLLGASFSVKKGEAHYWDIPEDETSRKKVLKVLKEVFNGVKAEKCGYDMKENMLCLEKEGIHVTEELFDVMIADYLLEPSLAKHDLEDIAVRHLEDNSLILRGENVEWDKKGQATLNFIATQAVEHKTCSVESEAVLRLSEVLKKELKEKHLEKLYSDVEMPLIQVLADMEKEGVGVI